MIRAAEIVDPKIIGISIIRSAVYDNASVAQIWERNRSADEL